MIPKIRLSLLAGVAALTIPAISYADMGSLQDGFFAGLGGSVVAPNYGYQDPTFASVNQGSNSILLRPDIYGGYGELVSSNNLYIGFDMGFQLGTNKTNEVAHLNGTSVVSNATEGSVYYVDVLPGFVFFNQSSIFYGIVGAAHGSFKLEQNGGSAFSLTESNFGYRLGMGYTLALTNSFSVDARYVFSNFGSIAYDPATYHYKLNPKNNAVSLGVNYTFDAPEEGSASPFVAD